MKLRVSRNYVNRRGLYIATLVLAAFGLDVVAAVGLSYVAGFTSVRAALGRFTGIWLVPVVGGIFLSFVGYYYAYRGAYRAEGGPGLKPREMRAVVTAGFGGFFAHGGSATDQIALQGAGASKRDAKVRVGVLGGLEHGALGVIGTAAGVTALLMAIPRPPLDFQYPWAIIPLPGTLLAFWLADKYRTRLRGRGGWREKLSIFLDSIHQIHHMARNRDHLPAIMGMLVFWLAELGAAWCALAAFGFQMNGAAFILGFLTGAVYTRRTGPFGGAGVLMLTLAVTIWYSGAPWAAAILGIFTTRFISLWLPLPFAVASLPTLRGIVARDDEASRSANEASGEPAIEPRKAS